MTDTSRTADIDAKTVRGVTRTVRAAKAASFAPGR